MKATYMGISMDGTPKEVSELIKLVDEQRIIKAAAPKYYPTPWWGTYPGSSGVYYTTGNTTTTGNIKVTLDSINTGDAKTWTDCGFTYNSNKINPTTTGT